MGWQTIEQRKNYYTASMMYKCIHGTAPVHLLNKLVMSSDTHDRTTRSSLNGDIQIPQPKLEIFRNSFKYQSAITWNSLPAHLKQAPDIDEFKRQYKSYYFVQNG